MASVIQLDGGGSNKKKKTQMARETYTGTRGYDGGTYGKIEGKN